MRYDAATRSVHGTVRNTLSSTLCYVQAEPHLKSGTKTVGELGPDKLGHLSPGQEVTSSLTAAGEPKLASVSSMATSFIWRSLTATALAQRPRQEEKVLKAAVNTAPVAKKVAAPMPWHWRDL